MGRMPSCLVDRGGKVYFLKKVHSHSAVAAHFGINEDKYLKYEYDLANRQLLRNFGGNTPFNVKQSHDTAALSHFKVCVGTPKKLIQFVKDGNWEKNVLFSLLTPSAREQCVETCAAAEKQCVETCAAAEKQCVETCAAAEKQCDETCAAAEKQCDETWAAAEKRRNETYAAAEKQRYETWAATAWKQYDETCAAAEKQNDETCAAAWITLFENSENRIEIWRK